MQLSITNASLRLQRAHATGCPVDYIVSEGADDGAGVANAWKGQVQTAPIDHERRKHLGQTAGFYLLPCGSFRQKSDAKAGNRGRDGDGYDIG
jgi:hypothetical protein